MKTRSSSSLLLLLPLLLLLLATLLLSSLASSASASSASASASASRHPVIASLDHYEHLDANAVVEPCPTGSQAELCVKFQNHQRTFDLALWENVEFLGFQRYSAYINGTHVPVTIESHSWYRGHVVGDRNSRVRLTVSKGHFYGSIFTDGVTYIIDEYKDRHTREISTVIYKSESLSSTPYDECVVPGVYIDPNSTDNTVRNRRAAPASSAHKFCEVFLDADNNFFEHWAIGTTDTERTASAIIRMVDVFHLVEGLYSDPENFGDVLNVRLAGVKIHTDQNFAPVQGTTGLGSQVLRLYQQFLAGNVGPGNFGSSTTSEIRGVGLPTSQEVCTNHLFTHVPLSGILGVAIQASPDSNTAGGICETRLVQGAVLNAGFSSTMSADGFSVPMWQNVLSTAHELGHNFGSGHDCELSSAPFCSSVTGVSACVPSAANGGSYLMYPAVSVDNSHSNARIFSPCSTSQIFSVINNKGSCFKTAVSCQTNPGGCCYGDQILPPNSVCNFAGESNPCQRNALCNGLSTQCPANPNVTDGTGCKIVGQAAGVCLGGVCVNSNQAFCAQRGLFGCSYPGFPCIRACADSPSGRCVPFDKACGVLDPLTGTALFISSASATCSVTPLATPCTTSAAAEGTCNARGTCVACGANGCSIPVLPTQPTPTCSYQAESTGPCTDPCGGGSRSFSYICKCVDGTIDATGRRCVGQPRAFDIEPCFTDKCPTTAAETLSLDAKVPLSTFDKSDFENLVKSVLQRPVTVTDFSGLSGTSTRVRLRSCRVDGAGCLDTATLSSLFNLQSSLLASSLGYSYSQIDESDNSFPMALIAVIVVCVIGFVIIVAALVYYVKARSQIKKREQRRAAREARRRLRKEQKTQKAKFEWDDVLDGGESGNARSAPQPGSRTLLLTNNGSAVSMGLDGGAAAAAAGAGAAAAGETSATSRRSKSKGSSKRSSSSGGGSKSRSRSRSKVKMPSPSKKSAAAAAAAAAASAASAPAAATSTPTTSAAAPATRNAADSGMVAVSTFPAVHSSSSLGSNGSQGSQGANSNSNSNSINNTNNPFFTNTATAALVASAGKSQPSKQKTKATSFTAPHTLPAITPLPRAASTASKAHTTSPAKSAQLPGLAVHLENTEAALASQQLQIYKAIIPFEAASGRELSLQVGDLVAVSQKNTGEEGWWRGEIGNRSGMFPAGFVVEAVLEDQPLRTDSELIPDHESVASSKVSITAL